MAGHHGGLLTIGVLATLWTASSGVEALRDALDRAYEVEDLAPIWWRRLQSMAVVVVGALVLFVASLAVILGPVLWRAARGLRPPQRGGGGDLDARPLRRGRRRPARWAWSACTAGCPTTICRCGRSLPGVLLTLACGWSGASLFSLYLGTVADYSVTYGSLAGVAITLLFFYLTGALFILGAEYNAVRLKDHGAGGSAAFLTKRAACAQRPCSSDNRGAAPAPPSTRDLCRNRGHACRVQKAWAMSARRR